jgi:hypothetical protein
MFRGAGQLLAQEPSPGSPLPQQWTYVAYGALVLVIVTIGLWMLARALAAARGEPAAHESRARVLLDRIGAERKLRISTRWRACPNGTMRWEVEAIDEHTGQRWLKTDRRLLAAATALAGELSLDL